MILNFCPICGKPPLVETQTETSGEIVRVEFFCKDHFSAVGKDYDEAIEAWNGVTKAYCDQEAMREFYESSR